MLRPASRDAGRFPRGRRGQDGGVAGGRELQGLRGGETLAEALARKDGMQRFAHFFRDESKLPGATIAQFDAIIQTMANKGCEKI